MDEVLSFLHNPCPSSQRIKIQSAATNGLYLTKEDSTKDLNRLEEHRHSVVLTGTDYAREIRQKENEIYLKNESQRLHAESVSGHLNSLEHLSLIGDSVQNLGDLTEESMTQVYKKYSFQMKEEGNDLAINDYKQQILDQICGFPVVIIEGPTGCGKTTQVPQWILDESYKKRKPCKIIVTQPRRIAAISIAKRVAQERGWDVGGLVGYQVGLENKTTVDTCIHYVTTGILLQKLVAAKTMNEYTHIILDEVHERGQEMDFLLLVVKKLLYTVSPLVKVILMSATFNRNVFADYFMISSPTELPMTSCVNVVKKQTMFSVKTFYLNHLTKFGSILQQATPKNEEPGIVPEMYHLVIKLLNAFEQIDRQEDDYTESMEGDLPSVLIFLPGINEIEELFTNLNDIELRKKVADANCGRHKWWVLPLHSTITADEQIRVFQRSPAGFRKIILATNIAESSITVPDIKYVIDFCLMKILEADEATNFTSLRLRWASKTNCEQRAGRAGRVRDGRVYRLVTDKFYETLPQETTPEILRSPLERLVLLAKMLDMGPPSDVLALAMDPPDLSNIHRTILVLKEIGALRKMLGDKWCPSDGDVTFMGRLMAKLPLDVKVSKLIMLGYVYGCLDDAVIMAAAMSVKNIFSSPFRERLNAYNIKLTWADGSMSDCIAFLNVYKVWSHLRQQQYFKQQGNSEAHWARLFYVQVRALRELDDMVRELRSRLSREGIDAPDMPSPWAKQEQSLVLKVIIAGAFYPQYFVQMSENEERERDAVKTLGGLDPRNTVYLKNFPDNQPGDIYATAIKNVIKQQIGDEPQVVFDTNSKKVFLNFQDHDQTRRDKNSGQDPTIPGQVVLPVYKAVKARQLRMDIRIPLLPLDKAKELQKALEETKKDQILTNMVPRLPEVDDTHFALKISQFINVGKFWVQSDEESTASELRQIERSLNKERLIAHTGSVRAGDVYAAPYVHQGTTLVCRVRLLTVLPREMVEVLYIDYGSFARVNVCTLYTLPSGVCRETPPLAMQCVLAEIAPSPLLEPHAQWTTGAFQLFQRLCGLGQLIGKVYSVRHGVVSIELLADGGKVNINLELLKNGYAISREESYESKLNHDLRQTATELNMVQKRAYNKEQKEQACFSVREVEAPKPRDCVSDAVLKGPFSPLETVVHNLMYSSQQKQVVVEWNSVNSVLLDTEPQQVYERLLVAAHVGQNESNTKLTLRHTTLLPNLPGLPAIIALLFCPTAELRRDPSASRYVSALCGLGSSDSGLPYFPEHDLLVNIDADLSIEDIGLINHIRHLMDYMMFGLDDEDSPISDQDSRRKVPNYIKTDFLNLLLKRRRHRETQTVVNAWEWKSIKEHELLEVSFPDIVDYGIVYQLHAPVELRPPTRDELLALKRDNDQLKVAVSRSFATGGDMSCKLCGTPPMPLHAMRIHLYSNAHRDREDDLRSLQS